MTPMATVLTLILLLSPPSDTVLLAPAEALRRVAEAPRVFAARERGRAGQRRAEQARAWPNPGLTVAIENFGAEEAVTGLAAPEGLEGQAVLGYRVPVGGDRGAAIREADAMARAGEAEAARVAGDAVVRTVSAAAATDRERALLAQAEVEARTLRRLADALTLQAREGRASDGEAARARLAATLAEGRVAEARASLAATATELARLLGYPPDRSVRIASVACRMLPEREATAPPELDAARSRETAAEAAVARVKAGRIPDLEPQVGLRRAAGTGAAYVGLGLQLPVFDRSSRAVEAAAAELSAARAERRAAAVEVEAQRTAAARAMEALQAAGARFQAGWLDDLARVVEATEARYELGEGTLVELLDGRRARSEALASRERWRAAWRIQRARLLRLSGAEATPDFFCDPLVEED